MTRRPITSRPRILVTGSRTWTDEPTIRTALTATWRHHGRPITVIHGACPTGADPIADTWAREHELHGITTERWPADWDRHGRAAGPIRNHAMLNSGITEVLAFPHGASPGTRGTIQAAHARGIPVTEHDHGRAQIASEPRNHPAPGPSPSGDRDNAATDNVGRILDRLGFRASRHPSARGAGGDPSELT